MDDSVVNILSIFESEESIPFQATQPTTDQEILYEVAFRVAFAAGITLQKPRQSNQDTFKVDEYLTSITEASECRIRMMALENRWWKEDAGPLIAFRGEGGRAGALLYTRDGYEFFDPISKSKTVVDEKFANELSKNVYRFYKTFPDEKLNWRHLVPFVFRDLKLDFKRILLIESVIGILSLFLPIVTGLIFQTIVPNADFGTLKQTIFILMVASVITTAFSLVEEFCVLRISFKSDILMQSALWDRVLRLPVSLLRKYNVGDLANRISGIDAVQQFLTSSMFTAVLHGTFSVISLLLMFYYDVWLALAATVLAVMAVFISFIFNLIQLRYQRPFLELQGKMGGVLFQLLTCVSKLKVAHSEKEAFSYWSTFFTKENKLSFKVHMNVIYYGLFTPFFTVLATIVIYTIAVLRGEDLPFGYFIGFSAAFGQFFGALLGMTSVINEAINILPVYERAKPFLDALPELESKGITLPALTGKIRIQNLTFKYPSEGSEVLEDISIDIHPGSFIAIVGPTGSGKSTLFRILLGFEEINNKRVFVDDVDFNLLNRRSLRKQLGVVTQNSVIIPGTIFDNITNHSPNLTLQDAFVAAENMCLLNEINNMPMGMFTWISEGGRNISVGQRQRILLARAVIQKPRILLLDEATSALDNTTQAKVHQNLAELNITKIVTSHRLSTVQNADCIYVIDQGRIIEKGTFLELQKKEGLFSNLINRQLV